MTQLQPKHTHTRAYFPKAQRPSVVKRGDIYYASLNGGVGSEQDGDRPVLVIQNDTGNKYSPTIIVVTITSKLKKSFLPTHLELHAGVGGLAVDSIAQCESIKTIDKQRLMSYMGNVGDGIMAQVGDCILASVGINSMRRQAFCRA